MKDHQIRAWLNVVDSGSIRAAARRLGLTQAAVTRAIRDLEEELDAPLVVRSSRGITVTEFGHALTGRLRLAQAQLGLARQDIAQMRGGGGAHVSVAVTPLVFFGVLPEVVRDFRRAMPLAQLTVEEGLTPIVLPALRQGTVDFAVAALITDALPSDIAFEPLRTLEVIVAGRRGHPLAAATRWEELLGCEWLMHLAPGSQHGHLLETLRQRGMALPPRIVRVNTFGVSWGLLTGSDAVTSIPAGMLVLRPYGEQICRIPLQMPLPPLTLGIMALRDSPLSFAAGRLADLFRRALAQRRSAPGSAPTGQARISRRRGDSS